MYWSLPTPDGMEYAIRDGDWKLILDGLGTPRHLYNLADDFYEVHNKLDVLPDKVAELKLKFERYRRDVDSDPIMRAREILDYGLGDAGEGLLELAFMLAE